MLKTFLTACLFLISFKGYHQNIKTIGKITDKSGVPIPYASIIFTNIKDQHQVFGVLGKDDGSFVINLPESEYSVEIYIVGLQSIKFDIDLRNKKEIQDLGDIIINPEVQLEEVVVKNNISSYKIELDKKIYDVSKDFLNNASSLIDVMQNVPSVQVEVDGNISIRGDGNILILIDGRINGLTNTASLLNTIPASSIKNIEVITNPSSKYSSDGSGGIINIVLKKGKKKRQSASFEVFSGVRLNSGTNINISNGSENSSWYINSGLGYSEPKETRELYIKNSITAPAESNQSSERILKQFYFTNNIGGQFSVDKKNSITTNITYRIANLNNINTIVYEDFNNDSLFASTERFDSEKNKNIFFQINADYELKLNPNGSKIELSISAQSSKEDETSEIIDTDIFSERIIAGNDIIFNDAEDTRYNVSLDYIYPIKNGSQLEFGFRNRITKIKNDFSVERFSNDISTLIPEFTDQTYYNENVTAFYGQYAKSYSKLKFQIGLRTEITTIDITSEKDKLSLSKNYVDLFPSSFLDYEFSKNHKVRLSVSRRIQRPRLQAITPFSSFSDARNIFVGNPEVNPSYITLAELGYQTKINNNFSLTPTLFYRKTANAMGYFTQKESISINGEPQEVFVTRTINIADNYSYGLELGFSYKPFNWLNFYNELTINSFKQKGAFQNTYFKNSSLRIGGRFHLNFNISKSFKLQIQNRFRNGNNRGQSSTKGIYRMDTGISKNLFNNMASLTINFKDIFDTWEWRIKTNGDGFTQDISLQVRTPQLNISFIYRFNQKKYKGKKGRQYDKL